MHDGVGQAVLDLRLAMSWSQDDLAEAMRHVDGRTMTRCVTKQMISEWENGKHSPSAEYRSALARVAMHCVEIQERDAHEARGWFLRLAGRFNATLSHWKFYADMKIRENEGGGD
jgi:transcriptional regulator with XRE-family HTH domain